MTHVSGGAIFFARSTQRVVAAQRLPDNFQGDVTAAIREAAREVAPQHVADVKWPGSRRKRHLFHVLAEQLGGDFVGEKIGWLIDRQTILAAIVQPHTGTGIGRALADRFAETKPPDLFICGRIVQEGEQILAGKCEERILVQNAGFGLTESVGAKTMLVDFDDQFAVAAKGPEMTGRQARVHSAIELVGL
jgi:hypothetical protein